MSGAYDERLLASAPAATRAEKQEGYNIDLLDNHHAAPNARAASQTPPPAPVPTLAANHTKAEAGSYAYRAPPALPWYRQRKYVLLIALGVVVVLAAVIGGAVGGTAGHKKNDGSLVKNGTDTGGAGGAAGPAVSEADSPGQAASRTDSSATATNTGGSDPANAAAAAAGATSTASGDHHD